MAGITCPKAKLLRFGGKYRIIFHLRWKTSKFAKAILQEYGILKGKGRVAAAAAMEHGILLTEDLFSTVCSTYPCTKDLQSFVSGKMLGIHWSLPHKCLRLLWRWKQWYQLQFLRPPEPIDEALFVLIVLPSASCQPYTFDRQTQALLSLPTPYTACPNTEIPFLQMYSV